MTVLRQISTYSLIGALNTGLGFLVIALMTFAGSQPLVANAAGFAAGLSTSFFLNQRFTFESRNRAASLLPFCMSFCTSYGLNIATLLLTKPLSAVHNLLPQLCAIVVYNLTFFIAMKFFVFPDKTRQS